jgi:hypothetical protein
MPVSPGNREEDAFLGGDPEPFFCRGVLTFRRKSTDKKPTMCERVKTRDPSAFFPGEMQKNKE